MSNYPDDINQYNNNPMSPFYSEPPVQCLICNNWFDPDLETLDDNDTCMDCGDTFYEEST